MHGVLTRRDVLDQALSEETGRVELGQMLVDDPVVAFPDETLRTVANRMASSGVTRMPVVERATRRVVGVVSLAQLLQARLRDIREARDAEQVLRFRLLMPTRRSSRRGRVPVG
jgi:predicted transcriptional regulator